MERVFLYDREIGQEMDGLSLIMPSGKRKTRNLAATLILTSLVDVFSILVIYLLVTATNNPHELNVDGVELPVAQSSTVIDEGSVVKVTSRGIIVDEKLILENDLYKYFEEKVNSLRQEKGQDAKLAIVIQADKSVDYRDVDPIVLQATAAGFSKLRFAVVQEEI